MHLLWQWIGFRSRCVIPGEQPHLVALPLEHDKDSIVSSLEQNAYQPNGHVA